MSISFRKKTLSSSLSKESPKDILILIQNLDQLLLFTCSDPNLGTELRFSQEVVSNGTGTRVPIDAVFDQDLGELLLYLGLQRDPRDKISQVAVRRFARHLMLVNEEFPSDQRVCSGIGSVTTYSGHRIVTLNEQLQDGAIPTGTVKAQKADDEWKTLDITKGYEFIADTPSHIYISTPSRNLDYVHAFLWYSETTYMFQIQMRYFGDWVKGGTRYWEQNRLKTALPKSVNSAIILSDNINRNHRLYIFWTEDDSTEQPIKYGYFALRPDGSIPRPGAGSLEILDVRVVSVRRGSSISGPAVGRAPVVRIANGRSWIFWSQDHLPKCASLSIHDHGAIESGLWTSHDFVLPEGHRGRPKGDATWNAIFVPPTFDP